eukprot:CAMPEP_0169159052 /NCGR_PEP_ID=MMETSP1015-20121227/55547_1 /TAXON_ID=342587 /ORGANISM="Karlodinium micrum, Strain CCMP2283" /LENGTH=107 /DNA_ID=CAMNT_0009230299 /DNA_START=17 /DNA_END=337 /DNA_ORIENTATION=-
MVMARLKKMCVVGLLIGATIVLFGCRVCNVDEANACTRTYDAAVLKSDDINDDPIVECPAYTAYTKCIKDEGCCDEEREGETMGLNVAALYSSEQAFCGRITITNHC